MNASDIFALGGRQETQDIEILSLFRQWIDACHVIDKTDGDDEPAWNAACDRQFKIEDRIFECGGGAIGIAVKAFLCIYRETSTWAPSTSQVRIEGDEDPQGWMANILRNAAEIVPEIGECAAAVIHDDAALIDADMDVGWATGVLAMPLHPSDRPGHRSEVREKLRAGLACIANAEAKTQLGRRYDCRISVRAALMLAISSCAAGFTSG
jgi:hypothetical protein